MRASRESWYESLGLDGYLLGERRGTTQATIVLLVLGSLAEAVGVLALFPAVLKLLQPGTAASSPVVEVLGETLRSINLEPSLTALFCVLLAGVLAKGVLTWVAMRQVGFVVADMTTELRLELVSALFRARWELFVRERLGVFANAVSLEASTAATAYQRACEVISRSVQIAMYTGIVLAVSWQLALITLAAGALVVAATGRFVRAGRAAGQARAEGVKAFIGKLVDSIHGMKAIRAMASESYFLERLRSDAQRVNLALKRQVAAAEARKAAQEPLLVMAIVVGLLFATRVIGETPAVVAVLGFVLFRLAIQLRLCLNEYQALLAALPMFRSVRRAVAIARKHEEVSLGDQIAPSLKDTIRLDRVSFSYGDHPILVDLSMELRAYQITAIVGPSGVGKSTLLDLLMAIQRPDSGEIFVDGVPLSHVSLLEWRQRIGYVPQDAPLIHDSVFANVALGQPASEHDVRRALAAAGAIEFVEELPEGLHTSVGEHGGRLSAGQRQRVALARALMRRPALLVLDEVTANLDAETARAVVATLVGLRRETTIVAVSHQPDLRACADRVYEIGYSKLPGRRRASLGPPGSDELRG